ncbi:MAG: serine protease [Solirubrobacterales bacterium]
MISAAPRGRAAVAMLAALALLGSFLLAASASAAPRSRGDDAGVSAAKVAAPAESSKATGSVIGGHSTTIATYPSLAFIEGLQATDGYACSGTVVAPRVILTAGHCVEDISSSSLVEPELIKVATGVSNLKHIPADKISDVERVIVNPSFSPSVLHGDAGLLILTRPVTATPIALATKAESSLYEAGTKLTVAGWGIDNRHAETIADQLQAATVPVEESKRCEKGIRRIYPFLDPTIQLCAIDAPKYHITTCHGDSGGPAMARRADGSLVEVGVTSLGSEDCKPTSPAVFTRVDQIQEWVQSWIDYVESGGAQPTVKVPKAHIPTMTRERGEELSYLILVEVFGGRFLHGQEQAIGCTRQSKSRLKCNVSWWKGANDYYGRLNVFYAIRHNVVLVNAHYAVHWVNDRCYFHSNHPASCQVHTVSH